MIAAKRILAVIPARGGSKRLPRKNILKLAGKPLIAWTIEAARFCNYVDRLIVSTEDHEISEVAKEYGAEVPFLRPLSLASDEASTVDVLCDLVTTLKSGNDHYDYVAVLQPTSPFRNARHLSEALERMYQTKATAVISVCHAGHHPLWCNELPKDFSMDKFIKDEHKVSRSQDLPDHYRLNGAIYICDSAVLIEKKTLFPSIGSFAYIMPRSDSLDIDTPEDFRYAQFLMDSRQ